MTDIHRMNTAYVWMAGVMDWYVLGRVKKMTDQYDIYNLYLKKYCGRTVARALIIQISSYNYTNNPVHLESV